MPGTSLATCPAPASQAIEYGGFRFPNGARTLEFTCRPQKDSTGRTITHSDFRITVEAELYGGTLGTSDSTVQAAVALLVEPGQPFVYFGRGCGNVAINLRGVIDCKWGPFTDVISLKPTKNQKVKITWTISFSIPTCADARYKGPMELVYGTSVSIDKSGLSTRTYKGFLKIANNRLAPGNRRVIESADAWRELINPPLLERFRRVPGEFTLSDDKCRLDFSIRDEEFAGENLPPENVIEVKASHSYGNSQSGRIYEWIGNLRATYSVAKGNRDGVKSAVEAFRLLGEDRLRRLFEEARAGAGGGFIGRVRDFFSKSKVRPCILPVSFRASEDEIYGELLVTLDMTYRVAGLSLGQILNLGGLWRPAPGARNTLAWATSVRLNLRSRGTAGISLYPRGEEELVDLCARIPVIPTPRLKVIDTELRTHPRPITTELRGGRRLSTMFRTPGKDESWLSYTMLTRVETDTGVVIGSTLPDAPLVETSLSSAWNARDGAPRGNDRSVSPAESRFRPLASAANPATSGTVNTSGGTLTTTTVSTSSGETFAHQRTNPTLYVYLVGSALRAGFDIPTPELTTLNGVDLVPANRPGQEYVVKGIVGQAGLDESIPLIGATWVQRYAVLGSKVPRGPMPVMPNPLVSG